MLTSHDKCTCCAACADACPKQCIEMVDYHNGFKYPKIDTVQCIDCAICEKVCHANTPTEKFENKVKKCYAVQSKDKNVLIHSTSGGVFTHLAKHSSKVAGASYSENFRIKHIVADEQNLRFLNGSKYAKSETQGIFNHVKKLLDSKQQILFTGTPCQVAALKTFLNNENAYLTTCEVFCHGVPSNELFYRYIENLQMNAKSKILKYIFRSKRKGWQNPRIEYIFADNNNTHVIKNQLEDGFWMAFGLHYSLMESCFHCKYRIKNRISDISIGDFWGIENLKNKFEYKEGVSAIFVNTEKGEKLINLVKSEINILECSQNDILKGNAYLISQYEKPQLYSQFWENERKMSLQELFDKYCKINNRFSYTLSSIKKKLKMVYKKLRNQLRKY